MTISMLHRVDTALLKKSSKESILMSISSQFWFLMLEYMNIVDRSSIHESELHSKQCYKGTCCQATTEHYMFVKKDRFQWSYNTFQIWIIRLGGFTDLMYTLCAVELLSLQRKRYNKMSERAFLKHHLKNYFCLITFFFLFLSKQNLHVNFLLF